MLNRIALITNEKDFLLGRRTPATAEVFACWLRKAIDQDEVLRIRRTRIPLVFPYLEDTPQAREFYSLAQDIQDVALFHPTAKKTAQASWIRNNQHYWQGKSILLANKILKVFPDHTQLEALVQQLLSKSTFERLQIGIAADLALYDLLEAGESHIKAWAENEGIDYPFKDFQELFIHILKTNVDYYYQNEVLNPNPNWVPKRLQKDELRGWLKFFNDYYKDEPQEQEYIKVLRDMGWEGYSLLALKPLKRDKLFKRLWQNYLKAQRATIELFDSYVFWRNGIPYETTQTSQKLPLQCIIALSGSMTWDLVDKTLTELKSS